MTKYGNHKTEVDGIAFDSKKEARRYAELRLLERAGEIQLLRTQPKFNLLPSKRRPDGVMERSLSYTADFEYRDKAGQVIVEDCKSPASRTQQYVIRRKLMLYLFGIAVREV